ncbi:MAG TPA: DNA gyrase modulator, partial [Ilumatobacteraceae bacterium]|nr:DNA gyrase modulator [Ilumatobacteraceae bacterium]
MSQPGSAWEFTVADEAVQAAIDAGARYADARVMHRRAESMGARNGDVDSVDQSADSGLGVRALVGAGWGFFAVADLDTRSAGDAGRRAAEIAAASATVNRAKPAAPGLGLVGSDPAVGSWRSECTIDPFGVSLSVKGDLLVEATQLMREHGADLAEAMYQAWSTDKWFVSSEGHRVDQRIIECGAGMMATSIGDGETQRRSYPANRGQYRTRGWEFVDELDLLAHAPRVGSESRALLSAPL